MPCYRVVDIPVLTHLTPAHALRGHAVHTAVRCLYMIRGLHKLAYMRYSKNFNLSHLVGKKSECNIYSFKEMGYVKKNLSNCLQFPIIDLMWHKYLHNVEPKVKINCRPIKWFIASISGKPLLVQAPKHFRYLYCKRAGVSRWTHHSIVGTSAIYNYVTYSHLWLVELT